MTLLKRHEMDLVHREQIANCGVVNSWSTRGRVKVQQEPSMPTVQSSSNAASRPITGHIAPDILGLYLDGQPDYKRVADIVKLTKEDLGKISKVSKSSVRFDDAIPAAMAIRLREIANIANLVAEFFDGDIHKVALWFELPNPHLGNVSPRTMIRGDRYKRLLNFVLESREAELAATHQQQRKPG